MFCRRLCVSLVVYYQMIQEGMASRMMMMDSVIPVCGLIYTGETTKYQFPLISTRDKDDDDGQ